MKHLKSRFLLALVVVIGILSSVTAFAEDGIMPHWSYIMMVSADMRVNDYNSAKISVEASSDFYETDSLKVTCELQQFKNGSWGTIKSWTESINDTAIMFDKNYAIYKGYNYRNRVTVKAYKDGKLLETVTENFDYGYYN